MSDYKSEIVKRAMKCAWEDDLSIDVNKLLSALESEGVRFPKPPKPVIEVSHAAALAGMDALGRGHDWEKVGRAMFPHILRTMLEELTPYILEESAGKGWKVYNGRALCAPELYQSLTGEEWPTP